MLIETRKNKDDAPLGSTRTNEEIEKTREVPEGNELTTKSYSEEETSAGKILPYSGHLLWIRVCIVLILAVYHAYIETTKETTLNLLLPPQNIVIKYPNGTFAYTESYPKDFPFLHIPQIPRFVLLWEFIGSAVYVLKVITVAISDKRYDNSYLPHHIASFFIGSVLAAAVYFLLITGSVS